MRKRTCTNCGKQKPLTEFYKNLGGKRPGLVASECKVCKLGYCRRYYRGHKAEKKVDGAARYRKLKDELFSAYGGYICSCCGETEPMFLTIDHEDGNGADHRRSMTAKGRNYRDATGYKTYRWLKNNGYPPGFRVLCANCNHGSHRNGGVCPHQRSEGSETIPKGSTPKRAEVRSPSS